MNDVKHDIRRIFTRIVTEWPALAPALGAIRLRVGTDVPTAGMSKEGTLYVNPEFWSRLLDSERGFLILHELAHLLGRHAERCGERDPGTWNVATDWVINQGLLKEPWLKDAARRMKEGVSALGDGIHEYNPQIRSLGLPEDKAAEAVYELLKQEAKRRGSGSGRGQRRDEGGGGGGDEEAQDEDRGQGGGGRLPEPRDGGSASDGRRRPWEDDEAPREGETYVPPEEIIRRVREAAQRNRLAGRGLGLPRFMEDLIKKSRTPWQAILRKWMRRLATEGEDPTYRAINRRQHLAPRGHVWPGRQNRPTVRVGVAIDTSGSIADEEVRKFLSEVLTMVHLFKEVVVWLFADGPYQKEVLRNEADMKRLQVCGGGTDVRPVFEEAKKERIDGLVVFTDGYTPWPATRPPFRTLVALVVENQDAPGWAEKMYIRPED